MRKLLTVTLYRKKHMKYKNVKLHTVLQIVIKNSENCLLQTHKTIVIGLS